MKEILNINWEKEFTGYENDVQHQYDIFIRKVQEAKV